MDYVYRNTTIEPDFETYRAADRNMGSKGIVYAEILPIPLQWLLVVIMGTVAWSEIIMLHRDRFEVLLDSLTRVYRRQVDIAADSPAEVIWFPDNLTGSIVSPEIFEQYCSPIYDYACSMFQQTGKLGAAHCDGDYTHLMDQIQNSRFSVVEAFTPPPMGNVSVAQARAAWPDTTISINVPGTLFSQSKNNIKSWIQEYLQEAQAGAGRFVIGCTENYRESDFEHAFSAIAEALDDYQS